MGRPNKAGVCSCGHEIRYWHDLETGQCMAGREWKGHTANPFGACPCVRKVKGKKMAANTTTRAITVDGDKVLDALDNIITGLQVIRAEVARAKTSEDSPPREGPHGEKQTASQTARARVDVATPSRHAEAPKSVAPLGVVAMPAMVRKMLIALAQHPAGLTKAQILIHTEYRASGASTEAFATMVREGWAIAHETNALRITNIGLGALGPFEKLPTGDALRAHLLNGSKLKSMDKKILSVVCDRYPLPISKGDVLDFARYAASGSSTESFARLVRFGYVKIAGPNKLVASKELFS